jgi:hypothetical protein
MQNIIIINIILRFGTKTAGNRAGSLAVRGAVSVGREGCCLLQG